MMGRKAFDTPYRAFRVTLDDPPYGISGDPALYRADFTSNCQRYQWRWVRSIAWADVDAVIDGIADCSYCPQPT